MARITFTTMYDTTMRNVQRNANKLNNLEEQIASGRKLNRPSDNPVGFTNALNYRNILNSLGQQRNNMDDGEVYMNTLENTNKSVNSLFERCRELAVQGSNDTLKHQERLFINVEVRQNLEQLVALSQTRHKDNFIFSGKWVNDPPYEIKKGEVSFGQAHPGISNPNFLYQQAATPLNAAHQVPIDPADPDTWTIFDSNETVEIKLFDNGYYDQNTAPIKPYPDAQRIIPGSFEGLNALGLLEKPEKNTDLDPLHPDYNKPDYEIDYVEGKLILLSDRAKQAFYNEDGTKKDPSIPPAPSVDPEYQFANSYPPAMSFEYIYKNTLDMSGEIYREVDTGATIKINNNPDVIFGRGAPGETDSFKEVIHLMQGLWYNDQPKIAEGIDTIDRARERNISEQVVTGSRLNRVDIVYNRNLDLAINNTKADSDAESVDLADAFSQFSLADAVYSASLQAAARMMQQSLMNFL